MREGEEGRGPDAGFQRNGSDGLNFSHGPPASAPACWRATCAKMGWQYFKGTRKSDYWTCGFVNNNELSVRCYGIIKLCT
jgi:hypothetical protein